MLAIQAIGFGAERTVGPVVGRAIGGVAREQWVWLQRESNLSFVSARTFRLVARRAVGLVARRVARVFHSGK